jgi:hypothetical protein
MASSLTISDVFRSVESVGRLVPPFFGSIFSARLAMIVLLSGSYPDSNIQLGTFLAHQFERASGPIVSQDRPTLLSLTPHATASVSTGDIRNGIASIAAFGMYSHFLIGNTAMNPPLPKSISVQRPFKTT